MSKDAKVEIPITSEQAMFCLKVKPDKRVHSFTITLWMSGCDVDLPMVETIITGAAEKNKLFYSEELCAVHHEVVAWDQKYEKWTFFECVEKNVQALLQTLNQA
jgi:hypothetical protein